MIDQVLTDDERAALAARRVAFEPAPSFDPPDDDRGGDLGARALAAATLETASARCELVGAVRRCARNGLAEGIDPAVLRALILARLGRVDPATFDDLAATVRGALDEVLGPEAGGR